MHVRMYVQAYADMLFPFLLEFYCAIAFVMFVRLLVGCNCAFLRNKFAYVKWQRSSIAMN